MQLHPSQIAPAEPFDVFYFIRNHTDATTYYVRGVVYDVKTGEVLETVDLAQSATNNRLFLKTLQAPPDPAGYGRNIVAIATVYTDSTYTTKSENYEEQEQYFLVRAELPLPYSAQNLDLRDLRDAIVSSVAKEFKKQLDQLPPPSEPSLAPITGALGALQREVNRIPKESIDLQPVFAATEAIAASVRGLPQPAPAADLSPVLSDIRNVIEVIRTAVETINKANERQTAITIREMESAVKSMTPQVITTLQEHLDKQELTIPFSAMKTQGAERRSERLPDLSHLMSV